MLGDVADTERALPAGHVLREVKAARPAGQGFRDVAQVLGSGPDELLAVTG
ncbi:hypothetical protein [Falsiroseomonas sp. HW251]|uniref:hypothetical protein n=1 Tax=Falsiroseomonas sp. HW251 TaxID=3390998 RepID=UPI003D321E2B